MNEAECAKAIAAAVPDGERLLEAHLADCRSARQRLATLRRSAFLQAQRAP